MQVFALLRTIAAFVGIDSDNDITDSSNEINKNLGSSNRDIIDPDSSSSLPTRPNGLDWSGISGVSLIEKVENATDITRTPTAAPSSSPSQSPSLSPSQNPSHSHDATTCHQPNTTYKCGNNNNNSNGFFDSCVDAVNCIESDDDDCWPKKDVLNCCDFGFKFGMTVVDGMCKNPSDEYIIERGPEPWCVIEKGIHVGIVDVNCDDPHSVGWNATTTINDDDDDKPPHYYVFDGVYRKAGKIPLVGDIVCGPTSVDIITQTKKKSTSYLEFCWN